jgi:hypothetical protein
MARPSLPTLTWAKSSVTEIANATPLLILTALKSLVASSTYWKVEADALTGAFFYVECAPKSTTSGVQNQRVVYAAQGSSSFNANVMGPGTTAATKSTQPTNDDIIALYAPEGGAGTKVGTFPDNAANNEIYGGSARVMGYYAALDNANASWTAKVWIIESAEVLSVCIENSTSNQEWGGVHGPMWIGASTAAQDVDVTDRIYGGFWHGSYWSTNWWSLVNNAFGDNANNAFNVHRAIVFDPDTHTELYGVKFITQSAPDIHNLVSKAGTFVGCDANYYAYDTKGAGTLVPDEYIGTLRQMRMGRDFTSRITIQDGDGATVAIVRGASPTADYDAMWFTNS